MTACVYANLLKHWLRGECLQVTKYLKMLKHVAIKIFLHLYNKGRKYYTSENIEKREMDYCFKCPIP